MANATKAVQVIRNFLAGTELQVASRYAYQMSKRKEEPPNLPDGDAHKLNNNYYYARDVRREVEQPVLAYSATLSNLLPSGEEAVAVKPEIKMCTPGEFYNP